MDQGRVERDKLVELLLQALETEIRGAAVYRAALACTRKDELRDEWQAYLEQTEDHEHILTDLCVEVGVDPTRESAGREAVRHLGRSLVEAIEHVRARGGGELAELVAAECVVIAETKDRLNWEVIGEVRERSRAASVPRSKRRTRRSRRRRTRTSTTRWAGPASSGST